jgi:putative tryptophan/tyrosine transport system substrate-binding protein
MKRREFIALVGGVAASLAFGSPRLRAQPSDRIRRVAAIIGYAENDSFSNARVAAVVHGLQDLGWIGGRNIEFDVRFSAGDVHRIPFLVRELIDRKPDIIIANTTPVTAEFARQTRAIPIVFIAVSDPIGSGFMTSLARPDGNITGLINVEGSIGSKWLELLKQVAPHTNRAAVLFNPDTAPYAEYYLHPIEAAAPSLLVETIRAPVRSAEEIEKVLAKLGRQPGSGVIGITDSFLTTHRQTVSDLALRDGLPTVLGIQESGALISYAPDTRDLFLRSAAYVDRILRGAKPADLPVQVPTKFEMVIDLRVAKTLGLEVPDRLLAIADQVIE